MSFLNRVILIGRLCKDPDIRQTSSNKKVGVFTLAVDRSFTKQNGTRETDFTDFIKIITWDKTAENCEKFLSKGSLIAVDGRLQSRYYEVDGQKRTVVEVVGETVRFLDKYGKKEKPEEEFDPNEEEPPF